MRNSRIITPKLSRNYKSSPQHPCFNPQSISKCDPSEITQCKRKIFTNPNFFSSNIQSQKYVNFARKYTASAEESKAEPSERVSQIVDEVSGLTLLEVADLTELLRQRLDLKEMPVMAVMMPGMGFSMRGGAKGQAKGGEEKKVEEKTAFDLKLEGFDVAAKIKVIKEVRVFTNLGLKDAKDLVEKAPTLLKKGVTKEEAEKIVEKMKEVGAKVSME